MSNSTSLVLITTFILVNFALFFGEMILDIFGRPKSVKPKDKISDIKLTLVIFTENNESSIIESLKSFSSLRSINTELLVVDNASSDNTPKLVKKYLSTHTNIKAKLIVRRKRMDINQNIKITSIRDIKKGIILIMKRPMIVQSGSIQKIKNHFRTREIGFVFFNIYEFSNLKIISDGAYFFSVFNYRFNKIYSSLSGTNYSRRTSIYAFRRSAGSVKQNDIINNSIYDRRIAFMGLSSHGIRNMHLSGIFKIYYRGIFHTKISWVAAVRMIVIALQTITVTLLIIMLVATSTTDPLLFVFLWLIFTASIVLSIDYRDQASSILGIKAMKHILISLVLFTIYTVYLLLSTIAASMHVKYQD